MKKLKIFLPSIALLVVLAFSITIGVYAATDVSFTVTISISFKSPDIGAVINCFVGDVDDSPNHVWNNVNTDGTLRGDNVTGFTEVWNLDNETLSFTGTSKAGESTLTLTFAITNKTSLPIYAYIADATSGAQITESKDFDGSKGTTGLVTATASTATSAVEIAAVSGETETTQNITIIFTLNKNVIRGEQVNIANLGWQVRLSKFNPTQAS